MARICSFVSRASILWARIASRILRNDVALVADEHQLGDLLRDGRAALHDVARLQVGERGAQMPSGSMPWCSKKRLSSAATKACITCSRDLVVGQDDALLQVELADELALRREHAAGA